jgi:hypothetical protein
MHFINSLAILSLAGLGLASPVNSPRDLTSALGGAGLGTLTGAVGGLGRRDETHERHVGQRARRQDDGGSDDLDGDGSADGRRALTMIRSRQGDNGQISDEPLEDDDDDYVDFVPRLRGRQLGEGAVSDEVDVDDILGTRGEGKHDSHGKGKADGQSNSNSKGKGKGQGKGKGKDQSKSKTKPKGDHQGSGSGQGKGKGKGKCNDARHTGCLHPEDVDTLVDAYVRMLSKWNDTDAKYLADDGFVDTSDSINILAGIPLGSPTFPTKQAFIDHQHTQVRPLFVYVNHQLQG